MAHSFHYVSWRWRSSRNNADIGNGFFSLSTFVILNAMAFKFDNALLYWLSAERKTCPILLWKRPDEGSGTSGTNQIARRHANNSRKKHHLHRLAFCKLRLEQSGDCVCLHIHDKNPVYVTDTFVLIHFNFIRPHIIFSTLTCLTSIDLIFKQARKSRFYYEILWNLYVPAT